MTLPTTQTTPPPISVRLGRFRAAIRRGGGITLERSYRVSADKRTGSGDDGYRRTIINLFADELPVLRELLSVAMDEVIDVRRPDDNVHNSTTLEEPAGPDRPL